jgi:hypothetical protein
MVKEEEASKKGKKTQKEKKGKIRELYSNTVDETEHVCNPSSK